VKPPIALLLAYAAVLAACSNSSNNAPAGDADAGGDARPPDAATPDAPRSDAPPPDAPPPDAPPADAPPPDAARSDGSRSEASLPDGSTTDASTAEAPAPDTSVARDGGGDGRPAALCDGPGARFVTDVVAHQFGGGQSFGQDTFPANLLGPPRGGGCCAGSLDVISLGDGGSVSLAFAGNTIVDGPGADFIVFENAFDPGGDPSNPYAEPGIVEVSQDGASWVSYPCTATSFPYGTCAGWHPVYANPGVNDIDPTDPATAGGDPFDLADVGLEWARYVRVTDRPGDGLVFDLDAVAIVNASCP
jgi:hypothetical protein